MSSLENRFEEGKRKHYRRTIDSRNTKYSHINPEIVMELIEKGTLPNEIAKVYGCSLDTLKNRMKAQGYEYDARNIFRRPDISIEEVVELKEKGYTDRQVAKHFNVGLNAIRRRLRKADYQSREKVEIDEDEIIRLKESGLSKVAIMRETGYSLWYVNKAIKTRTIEEKITKKDISDRVCDDYKSGMKPYKIAEKHKIDGRKVYSILNTRGFKPVRRPLRQDITPEIVLRLYNEEKMTIEEITKHLNCSEQTVYYRLKQRRKKLKGGQRKPNLRNDLPKAEIRREFRNGKSLSQLSVHHNSTIPTIKKILGIQ